MLSRHRKLFKPQYRLSVQTVYLERRTPTRLLVVYTDLAKMGPIPVAAYTMALTDMAVRKPVMVWRTATVLKS